MSADDLDDLRVTLSSVDRELDHARVRRDVHARSAPRPAVARWTPLAAAAAVACVLLASVVGLAWVTARDGPGPAQPASVPPAPDPAALAADVRAAVAEGGVACSRVEQQGRVISEQLQETRSGRTVVVALGEEEAGGPGGWPGCGTGSEATEAPTAPASAHPTFPIKVLLNRDLFGPLDDPRYAAGATSPTTLTLVRTTGPDAERLRYDYDLDPVTLRPVVVRVTAPDGGRARVTVAWFRPGSEQARYLRAEAD